MPCTQAVAHQNASKQLSIGICLAECQCLLLVISACKAGVSETQGKQKQMQLAQNAQEASDGLYSTLGVAATKDSVARGQARP